MHVCVTGRTADAIELYRNGIRELEAGIKINVAGEGIAAHARETVINLCNDVYGRLNSSKT
jgi:hypothetical protein